jgi:hypothetical protein
VNTYARTHISLFRETRNLRWLLGLCGSLGVASYADAQSASTVSGLVVDQRGHPVSYAEVSLREVRLIIRTDSIGEFMFTNVREGTITVDVRRLGFSPSSTLVTLPRSALRLVLEDAPAVMRAVAAGRSRNRGLEDFQKRRLSGRGLFVTRADIEERRPTRLSDMLRNLPGVRIERGRGGGVLRFNASLTQRRDCVPQYWLDGQHLRGAQIDDFPPGDVEGVELYSGPANTPLQFSSFGGVTTCGTVVIWSRPPAQ